MSAAGRTDHSAFLSCRNLKPAAMAAPNMRRRNNFFMAYLPGGCVGCTVYVCEDTLRGRRRNRERADALHTRARPVPPHGAGVRRERDQSPRARVGGERMDPPPRRLLRDGPAGHAGAGIRSRLRRPGCRSPVHGDPGRGVRPGPPRLDRDGAGGRHRHGDALAAPFRQSRAEGAVPDPGASG